MTLKTDFLSLILFPGSSTYAIMISVAEA